MDVFHTNTRSTDGRPATRRATGLTLTELLAGLAVAAILLAMAVPSFSNLKASARQTADINTLVTSLQFARSEAIARGIDVVVCTSTDGHQCDSGSNWQNGWIVFPDHDGSRTRSAGEPLLAVQPSLPGARLGFKSFGSSGNHVLYRPNGSCRTNGTFTYCNERGEESARAVIIGKTGRIRTAGEKADGTALACP